MSSEVTAQDRRKVIFWLTVGSLIPLLGWLYGVWKLWASCCWSIRDKAVGTLLVPGGVWGVLTGAFILGYASLQACTSSSSGILGPDGQVNTLESTEVSCTSLGVMPMWLAWLGLGLLIIAAIAGPLWLYFSARRHQGEVIPTGSSRPTGSVQAGTR